MITGPYEDPKKAKKAARQAKQRAEEARKREKEAEKSVHEAEKSAREAYKGDWELKKLYASRACARAKQYHEQMFAELWDALCAYEEAKRKMDKV